MANGDRQDAVLPSMAMTLSTKARMSGSVVGYSGSVGSRTSTSPLELASQGAQHQVEHVLRPVDDVGVGNSL